MRIVEQTPSTLKLKGIPGGFIWMTFAMLFGLLVMAASCLFAWTAVMELDSYWPLLPLGFGFIFGSLFAAIGFLSLFLGRITLTLDRRTGQGHYRVRSPVIDAGKPIDFELSQIKSVQLQRSCLEPRSSNQKPSDTPTGLGDLNKTRSAKYCTATLLLTKRRRKIQLDETQNWRESRVRKLADEVAEWLHMPLDEAMESN